MAKLTEADERTIRATGVDRKRFIEERDREEQAAKTGGGNADGLTAEDERTIRATGVSRKAFIEERRRETGR